MRAKSGFHAALEFDGFEKGSFGIRRLTKRAEDDGLIDDKDGVVRVDLCRGLIIGKCLAGPVGGFLASGVAGEFVLEAGAIHVHFRMRPDADRIAESADA